MSDTEWEYNVVDLDNDDPRLHTLGRGGWELVAAERGALYFRRPRLSFRDRVTLEQKHAIYRSRGIAIPEDEVDR
jgi:hypothetical protein